MKRKIIGLSFLIVAVSLIISSFKSGPAVAGGWDCTGAETANQNPSGCSAGSGCHASNATPAITVSIELDSLGVPVTHYIGGMNYTVKLSGTNTGTTSLPKFGFQIVSIAGTSSKATPTNAGTWVIPSSSNIHLAAPTSYTVLNIVEQSRSLSPTTGTGGHNSTYVESFSWTAPVAGTGTISIWGVLNAVDGNGGADGSDLWNVNKLILNEEAPATPTSISSTEVIGEMKVYPNPVADVLNMRWGNGQTGNYLINVYNLQGQTVLSERTDISGSGVSKEINTATWQPGIYIVLVEKDNMRRTFRVVKQ